MATTQQLETQLLEYINKKEEPVSFQQKKEEDLDFGMSTQSIKSSFSKPIITMAIGSASSSLLAGALASAIPVNLQFFAGMPTIVAGILGRVFVGTKSKTGKDFFDGVLIAGISQTVSRFIPASFGQFGQQTKEQFKQEVKPCCDDIHKIRSDVAW